MCDGVILVKWGQVGSLTSYLDVVDYGCRSGSMICSKEGKGGAVIRFWPCPPAC